jgi:hypothetical protein
MARFEGVSDIHYSLVANSKVETNMAYRVVFLFGIGELYQSIDNASQRHLKRSSPHWSPHVTVEWWFRYLLTRHLFIDLTPNPLDQQSIGLEAGFLNNTSIQADVLYRQVIPTIYAHRIQCFTATYP